MKKSVLAIALATALSSCAAIGTPPEGKVGGEVDLIAAMGDGALGADLATRLGKVDRIKALEAEYRALEYGTPGGGVAWTGKKPGQSGIATAGQPYQVGSQNCRQINHAVTIAGAVETRRGSACRNRDGSWSPLG